MHSTSRGERGRDSLGRRIYQSVRSRPCRLGHSRRLETISAENMKHGFAFVQQIVRDDTSMAAPPYRFRAHDCATLGVCQSAQCIEAGPEGRGQRTIRVIMKTVIVPKGVYGRRNAMFPSAETSECRDVIVGDVKFGECPGQRLAIVLRVR